jgi:L-asparaginase II
MTASTTATATATPVLVEALRGGIVESFHRGSVAIVDAGGAVHTAWGDIDRPVFPRSAVKLLQALPLVASGAADALGLDDAELALACSSHNGEPVHVRTAASMLAKAGVDAAVLECGAHWPYHDASLKALVAAGESPGALHNNCSGKHAGFVCLACRMAGGAPLAGFVRGYVQPDHAVMRTVTAALQSATGFDLSRTARGVDGCSIPTYAIPLRHLAHAFAKVAAGHGLGAEHDAAARRLRAAIAAAPQMVAGSGRVDTRLMAHFGSRVCCKGGAEGVHCIALPELGLGIALKMDDGNTARAADVATAALVERLLPCSDADRAVTRAISDVVMRNWNGIEVGRLRAAGPLAPQG